MRSLHDFVAVHASVHNHFHQERSRYSRSNFKLNRAVALAEWRGLGAAQRTVTVPLETTSRSSEGNLDEFGHGTLDVPLDAQSKSFEPLGFERQTIPLFSVASKIARHLIFRQMPSRASVLSNGLP